jgi:GNAT superfamily N-acetyltransferase
LDIETEISPARPEDTEVIVNIHLAARRESMPYLPEFVPDEEIYDWFTRRPRNFWVARCEGKIVGYMYLHEGGMLDDLYVLPDWQGRGVGSSLLAKAKSLSPLRIELSTFQRNTKAKTFYEAHGFCRVGCTNGQNQEGEPDVQYEWTGRRSSERCFDE